MKDLQTLRLVESTDRVSACPVCGSHYAASAVGAGDRCPLCSFAAVVIR
jgi:formate dehydrogenase maturation protein FdhE